MNCVLLAAPPTNDLPSVLMSSISRQRVGSIDPAKRPVPSFAGCCRARVIGVGTAHTAAAGSRARALGQRLVAAIYPLTAPQRDMHADRNGWIVGLGPGLTCCRN